MTTVAETLDSLALAEAAVFAVLADIRELAGTNEPATHTPTDIEELS